MSFRAGSSPAGLRPLQEAQLAMGRNRFDLIGSEVVDVRDALMEALRVADDSETRDIHVRLAGLRNDIDDLLAVLTERGSR
jgi:hypothetical protein